MIEIGIDEHKEISGLNVSGIDDLKVTWNVLKKQTQNQRRLGKTSQESSDGKVSIFGIPICVEMSK